MSDETNETPAPAEDHECAAPGSCIYHQLAAAKVRAVTDDDEIYVNAHDLSEFMQIWYAVEMSNAAEALAEGGMPHIHIQVALTNHNMASIRLASLVHGLAHDTIRPLSEIEGTLVSPQEMRDVPDTVPTAWAQEKESQ